ncbi:MAG: alpha/beta hydrolase [Pseudorhodoplanes sp.]|nr:alpha/beta hydrolase [Pseudorhodoplanes sp.]
MTTARDGCRLFASVTGEGEPLFLIPGLGGSSTFWAAIVPLLQSRFKVILMDHRGTGKSDRPEQPYSVELLARDAVDVLDHFNIPSAHIVGHSTGGAIAQVLAIDHASRVKSIVLSGSWAKPDPQFTLLFESRLAILKDAGAQAYAATGFFLACPPEWIRENFADIKAAIERAEEDFAPVDVVAERIKMILRFDRTADLHRIATPTLVLAALDDAIIPFHMSESLLRAIMGAQLTVVHGGHFFPRVDPPAFADHVAGFIEAAQIG